MPRPPRTPWVGGRTLIAALVLAGLAPAPASAEIVHFSKAIDFEGRSLEKLDTGIWTKGTLKRLAAVILEAKDGDKDFKKIMAAIVAKDCLEDEAMEHLARTDPVVAHDGSGNYLRYSDLVEMKNLRNLVFEPGTDLGKMDFTGADFTGSTLDGVKMDRCRTQGCTFSETTSTATLESSQTTRSTTTSTASTSSGDDRTPLTEVSEPHPTWLPKEPELQSKEGKDGKKATLDTSKETRSSKDLITSFFSNHFKRGTIRELGLNPAFGIPEKLAPYRDGLAYLTKDRSITSFLNPQRNVAVEAGGSGGIVDLSGFGGTLAVASGKPALLQRFTKAIYGGGTTPDVHLLGKISFKENAVIVVNDTLYFGSEDGKTIGRVELARARPLVNPHSKKYRRQPSRETKCELMKLKGAILGLRPGPRGEVLAVLDNGFSIFNFADKTAPNFQKDQYLPCSSYDPGKERGRRCLAIPSRAKAYVHADGSLVQWDLRNGQTAVIDSCDGLAIHDMTAGPDGCLWFTLPAENRVGRLSDNGKPEFHTLPRPGSRPTQIIDGGNGNMYVLEDAPRICSITAAPYRAPRTVDAKKKSKASKETATVETKPGLDAAPEPMQEASSSLDEDEDLPSGMESGFVDFTVPWEKLEREHFFGAENSKGQFLKAGSSRKEVGKLIGDALREPTYPPYQVENGRWLVLRTFPGPVGWCYVPAMANGKPTGKWKWELTRNLLLVFTPGKDELISTYPVFSFDSALDQFVAWN